ncbi:hypothetical protein AB0395_46465 [Streptosporangium sp. NPDC051023]|uniref:hypothetical protein n=1 Tax=Streptosporangium sp. NPDC051023 TaxID=3155410 RepID=UPI003450D3DE
MALSGWPIPERALSSDQDATWHGALRDPARRHGGNEDAIQAGPFLIGSGVILLAVVLVFRGTLDADRRLERTRRSRLHRRLERSNEELAQRAREGEDRRALDAPEAEAEPEARPGPLV